MLTACSGSTAATGAGLRAQPPRLQRLLQLVQILPQRPQVPIRQRRLQRLHSTRSTKRLQSCHKRISIVCTKTAKLAILRLKRQAGRKGYLEVLLLLRTLRLPRTLPLRRVIQPRRVGVAPHLLSNCCINLGLRGCLQGKNAQSSTPP